MKLPIIVLNLKAYKKGISERALELVKICERVSKKYGLSFVACVQPTDLYRCASSVSTPVFSQHFDPVESGANTGSVTVNSIKENKAFGTLLNHSEKRIGMENMKKCVELAKKYNLVSLCCVENLEEAKEISESNPDFVAYEDKDLIGSGKSITESQPDEIKKFVEIVGDKSIPLTGAGVSSPEDVKQAIALGTKGVLLASAFVKSENPESFLENIAKVI